MKAKNWSGKREVHQSAREAMPQVPFHRIAEETKTKYNMIKLVQTVSKRDRTNPPKMTKPNDSARESTPQVPFHRFAQQEATKGNNIYYIMIYIYILIFKTSPNVTKPILQKCKLSRLTPQKPWQTQWFRLTLQKHRWSMQYATS